MTLPPENVIFVKVIVSSISPITFNPVSVEISVSSALFCLKLANTFDASETLPSPNEREALNDAFKLVVTICESQKA